ncbi:MAG TPA: hypothetical protein VES20_12160, partial [Bryobacteraceae bacterium]|nr:hypothetical protein [Bryobacteraceae bacterium]
VPNLGRAVADVQRIVTTQAAQSPELRQWLQTQFPDFEKAAKHVGGIGEYLGEEIVVSFEPRCRGFCGVFIADVNRPGLKEYLQKEMPAGAPVLVTDLANLPAVPSDRMYVALTGNRVFVGAEPAFIRQAAAGNSKFAQTSFGQAVGEVYRRGAGVLVAANVGSVIERENTPGSVFSALGIDGMRHLIAEQRELGGKTTYSAVVTFDGQRRGVASWLAEPGSMGGLGFVSRDALFATAWVVKNPAQMLEDALTLTRLTSREELNVGEFEARTGVKLEDVAQALGSEVVFALDGPMVPTPAWKAVLEVKDSAKLQTAISKMVATANQSMPAGTAPIELTDGKLEDKQQGAQNMVAYKLSYPGGKMAEAHYAYVDGYMVIASTEAFLQRAIVDRRAGVSLSRSQEFRRLLPGGEHLNPSGIVYQNAGEVIRLMAKGAAEAAGNDAERQKRIEELAGNVEAGLVAVYGSADRIEVASQGSALNLLSQTLAGQMFGGPQSRGTTRSPRSYR